MLGMSCIIEGEALPWDIAGHTAAVASLQSALVSRRTGHAYMLMGRQGIGKARLAKIFAQALLCAAPDIEKPCGTCHNCQRVEAGYHPDLHWLMPTGNSIGINQVRSLHSTLALKPYYSSRRVCVIDDADTLTEQAQNSLLKSLEEPAGGSVLILVAHRPSALLPTIRSRCQMMRLRPLRVEELAEYLESQQGMSPKQAALAAALSEGCPGLAMQLDISSVVKKRDQVAAWVESLRNERQQGALRIAAELDKEEDLTYMLDLLAVYWRDIWHRWLHPQFPVVNIDIASTVDKEAQAWGATAGEALEAMQIARRQLQQNANRRLVLDAMLMNMQRGTTDDIGSRSSL